MFCYSIRLIEFLAVMWNQKRMQYHFSKIVKREMNISYASVIPVSFQGNWNKIADLN